MEETIGNFFKDIGKTISDGFSGLVQWFRDIIKGIGEIFKWLGNFFKSLLEFFIHIFVPTEEQWNAIKQDYKDLGDTFKNHLPFIGFFSDELEKAKDIVYNEDFLNIKFQGWSFDLGIIHFTTPDINFTGVLEAYEPYRMTIRSLLAFIMYCLGTVYLIKYILKSGETQGNYSVIDKGDRGNDK